MTMVWILFLLLPLAWLVYALLPTVYYKYLRDNSLRALGLQGEKQLLLSFDDGPDETYTPQLLDLLAAEDVKAVFFILAEKAKRYPELLARLRAEGHMVALHGKTHKNMWLCDYLDTQENLVDGAKIWTALGGGGAYYRPPHGNINLFTLHFLKKCGLKLVFWTVMAQDWRADTTSFEIYRKLCARTKDGAIICLHDAGEDTGGAPGAPARTIDALKEFLPRQKSLGYRFVLPPQ